MEDAFKKPRAVNNVLAVDKRNVNKRDVNVVAAKKRKRDDAEFTDEQLSQAWREALGQPPPFGKTRVKISSSQFMLTI